MWTRIYFNYYIFFSKFQWASKNKHLWLLSVKVQHHWSLHWSIWSRFGRSSVCPAFTPIWLQSIKQQMKTWRELLRVSAQTAKVDPKIHTVEEIAFEIFWEFCVLRSIQGKFDDWQNNFFFQRKLAENVYATIRRIPAQFFEIFNNFSNTIYF